MATDTPKPVDAVDDKDYIYGWTAQQGVAPEAPESVPGNVVTYDELPWEDSLVKAGIDPEQYRSGLVIADDEAEKRTLLHEDRADEAQAREGKPAQGEPQSPKDAPDKDAPKAEHKTSARSAAKKDDDK